MTRDAMRPASAGNHGNKHTDDLDLLAGLWEEARFARLPWDAPSELRDLVDDIDNPKRVYTVHKASRRHNFQQLVQKYIVQLREGCGAEHCTTSTCFTCRKRIVGRAPIRRYNTTSARTLAVYLASQDNPESGLCPNLRLPKTPPAAINSLVNTGNGDKKDRPKTGSPRARSDTEKRPGQPGFTIVEEPSSKDHRSFAANVFGTVAFKMLEWLTPAALEDMSRRTRDFRGELEPEDGGVASTPKVENGAINDKPMPLQESPLPPTRPNGNAVNERESLGYGEVEREPRTPKDDQQQHEPLPCPRTTAPRRNSNAKVRTTSGQKPKRQLSIDPYTQDASAEEPYAAILRSPRATSGSVDKGARVPKTAGSSLSRPISQLSSAGFFDDVTLEKMPPPKPLDLKSRTSRAQLDGVKTGEARSPKAPSTASGVSSDKSCSDGSVGVPGQDSESEEECLLPQAFSRLDAELVDFVCDVIQEDGTAEKHMFEPQSVNRFHNRHAGHGRPVRRKRKPAAGYPTNLRLEWKLFVEQTLFYVLSDPQLALRSFTTKGQLYDSQTLWYCMLRMTRVAPSLVFHSLWMAAASLFAPPKRLQTLRSPTTKVFPMSESSLSNLEAGRLMSICLHALIAAAPLVTDSRQLYDMSRIRSHGLSLAGSGAVARQPTELCLQYEDAFTDDLAMRLARRLFAAITTRRRFDALSESNIGPDEHSEQDVLAPLFSQLDFLNMDAVYVLDFSFPDRALHETRVPVLLLDWARAVMLNDWEGAPEVPGDGPFGGALALIEAMCKLTNTLINLLGDPANSLTDKRRHELLLADAQFRSDYFAERLDTIKMPLSWLSHTSTRQRLHLLDFPYIFSPSTLVSYFRAINFSRMSRSFEESTAFYDKIKVLADRAGLTQHHKDVLVDRLRPAGAKYLILDIRRGTVLEDAFDQLWRREERELLNPLKVHLGESNGEEGFDSGGVQQEFFRLAIAEALNPDHGAFTVDERTRMAWFLIGLLVSLAVYNGLTLPVTFPKALYRKLLGEPVTELHHIADGWPDLASALPPYLSGTKKTALSKTSLPFPKTVSVSSALPAPHESNPAEDEAPLVTSANRNAYVSDYIRYLTDVSVRPQYDAFARGFHACLHPKSLSLLTPNLLQSVVEGVQEIDVAELKRYTRYVGWDASHRTVKDFWSVVKRFDDRMKRKLLEFVTASDRVPVGGVKNMMFIVQRNGEEDDPAGRLPTSYTCYGTLLLPEYRDREMLRERLGMALENAQGFGFA
ncbi:hypothetical protein NEMBOFW57_008380 [Staphylotrichum longicolle]|uniref:HECT-type E3 ubiquitin transferase n=1 Tax=Staphylotrichum longicolle TaxID=669026 RepID=A0AAD4ER71_9PEZI|nr:hypothetical protein NEMBOFW57_008380 [Staphylotrichum longicolle]